jgi:ABC-2 type transport system permease protein
MMKRKFLPNGLASLQSFWANPVVVRDLRAQMRGTKSYWFQGAYLLLLGVLAISGYAQATGQSLSSLHGSVDAASRVSMVDAQDRLEGFYYFIFLTLAALISLIAPALTAGSVIGERQRQSLDLLITTPLTAGQLLVGKLLSSIAFLGLLLGLSLPASALCVLLGGATLGDVFRIYALLAIDGIVLAGIGLFFSCASRTPLLALVWTYLTVTTVLVGTWVLYFSIAADSSEITRVTTSVPLLSITALNPFVAVLPAGQGIWHIGLLPIPVWLGSAVAAVLIVRLLVTASAYRLGVHGGESGPSLRRQSLLLSGIGMFVITYSCIIKYSGGLSPQFGPIDAWICGFASSFGLLIAFLVAVPFLPGLFVPVVAEDAPPGMAESGHKDDGLFRFRRAFAPEHAGALPYYLLLVLTLTVATVAAYGVAIGTVPLSEMMVTLPAAFHISGLGFCVWAISRFTAGLIRGATQARALSFGIFALLCAGPILILSLITKGYSWDNEPVATLWLLYPFLTINKGTDSFSLWMLICGLQAFTWGFVFILARMRWNRPAVTATA